MLEQVPRYQKDTNVISKKVTKEYKSIKKILELIPKGNVLDIAGAEGFITWMADKVGHNAVCVEIDEGRVLRGRKNLGIDIRAVDVFENLDMLEHFDIFVVARFFHNIGMEKSVELMGAIDEKKDYILIVKYKPGLKKETGARRELLATKKGIKELCECYNLAKKSFPGEVIVAAKGKYAGVPNMLRKHIGEGA